MKSRNIKTHIFHKKKRFDPHPLWRLFCILFLVLLMAIVGYLSWYFLQTTKMLDAPAAAYNESNKAKIMTVDKNLSEIETVVQTRMAGE